MTTKIRKWLDNKTTDGENIENMTKKNRLLEGLLNQRNARKSTLLHLCAENNQNSLLVDICQTEGISKESKQNALTEKTPDGRSVLDLCRDEETLMTIISKLNPKEMNLSEQDKKGRNIFHHLVKKDFAVLIKKLKTSLARDQFVDMILQPSNNGSNVLMRAALQSATKSLDFLLCYFSQEVLATDEQDKILHETNEFGNNLLALVLQQREALKVSKQILLNMEKTCHASEKEGSLKAFIECLKKHIDPSIDVLEAMNDVESMLPKSSITTAIIIVKAFIEHFMLPVAILWL